MPHIRSTNADRVRLLQIEWESNSLELPLELEAFDLTKVGSSDVYEIPFCFLNSRTWEDFEDVMADLSRSGVCKEWRILNLN